MLVIFRYFWQICLFQHGPERIPRNLPITLVVLFIYLLIAMMTVKLVNPQQTISQVMMAVGISSSIETTFLFSLLAFKSVSQRFLSTFCALLGSNTIFLVLLLPVNLMLMGLESGVGNTFLQTVWMLSFFWWLNIVGFIFHRAANISLLQGTLLAFIIELVAILAITQFQQTTPGT